MIFKTTRSASGKEWLCCRDVLWYLVFCGFAMSYMLRLNLSLAIVAMVVPRSKAAAASQCIQDVDQTSNFSSLWVNASSVTNAKERNVTHISLSSLALTTRTENIIPVDPVQYPDRFSWNEYEQGLVLGAFFWIHWVMPLPGGLLARRYGTKLVFGLANLVTALLGFLIPFAARYHLYALVCLRFLQGIGAGVIWPSMHDMTAKWIPPNERNRFISSYLGSSVGAAATYPLCAMLINWLGWDSVFYVTSALGVIWCIAWYYLAYDTPQKHPRISVAEKNHILENLGDSVNHVSSQHVPWKAILTSGPFWITTITSLGANWGLLTLLTEAPSYFNYVHGWNISATGMLAAAPQLMRMLFSFVFSILADWILRTKRMSTTNLRKFATFVCSGIQSMMLLGLAYSGCHPNLAIIFMITGSAASGSYSAGVLAGLIDLSPNYASILSGISNLVVMPAGFISPLIIGYLTNDNQTIEAWRSVFLITVAIMFSTGALYIFFGSSDLQSWNDAGRGERGEELQKLQPNSTEVKHNKEAIDVDVERRNETLHPAFAIKQ